VARWGPLAWIETGFKSCGFLCAYRALESSITTDGRLPAG